MPVHYNGATQNSRMTATLAQIDASATEATLEIGTGPAPAFGTLIVALELDKPSFAVVNAVGTPVTAAAHLNLLGTPISDDVPAGPGGTAAMARIKDGAGVVIVDGLTVGTTGSDINLNSVSLSGGQTVTITQGTITHAT